MPSATPEVAHVHTVLLVDDYDDTREGLAAILRVQGYDVVTAWSAEDALRQFREGFRPCVALLDLRMPGMDGWGLWQRMREDPNPELATVPVVIVSGDINARDSARKVGIREFLTKPVEPEKMIAAIEQYCRQRRANAAT